MRSRPGIAALALALGALGALACIGPPPPVPSAVIRIDPGSVCEGDAFTTDVVLDGTSSMSRLTLVPAPIDPDEPPLLFAWRLDGAEHVVVEGTLDGPRIVARTAGDRPLHASLTVTNGDGASATTVRTVSITRPERTICDRDDQCLEGERCHERSCVPDHPCGEDAECEPCFVCDEGTCAPREGA